MMDWNDYIEQESQFVTLPEGDYNFTIMTFEKAKHEGSAKIPAGCNKALIELRFDAPGIGKATIKDSLILHESLEWKLCAFFRSIGQKQHGHGINMDWSKVLGAKGRAHVIINDQGYNRVDKYLDPEENNGALPWGD